MRCCFVIEHIGALGGTERSTCRVMTGLAREGRIEALHLLEVAPVGPPLFALDERIVRDAMFTRKVSLLRAWPRLVARLRAYVREHRIDTVVVVESTHALYAVPALAGTGVRCIVWEHFNFGFDLGKRKRRIGRRMAALWADDIVTLTQRDTGLWRAGTRARARLNVIPNAAPDSPPDIQYPAQSRMVLAAGRLTSQKGFDRLVAAWKIVRSHPAAQTWQLVILGDGPEQGMLQARITEMGLAQSLLLLPATGQVDDYFRKAALYACSSRHEGLPMVLLEAIAAGVPIVSFDCETGPAEIIGESDAGILVAQDDVDRFAQALIGLIDDPARREHMARAALMRAAAFSEPAILARWDALLFGNSSAAGVLEEA